MRRPHRQGSALIVSLVVMAVLAVLAMGAIAFTGKERAAAAQTARASEVRACAETARAHLLARLKAVGNAPLEIKFADRLLDARLASRRSVAQTGHYGEDGATITGATLVSAGVGSTAQQARDLTNVVAGGTTLGGQYYHVVVHCESRGKQSEIEFLIRFGI